MNKYVWHNPYLPQTLQVAEIILYFSNILSIVFIGLQGGITLSILAITALQILAAFGIANLRWWGIILGVVSVAFQSVRLTFLALQYGVSIFDVLKYFLSGNQIINTMFTVAILVLLLHPMSRSYAKANFTKRIP